MNKVRSFKSRSLIAMCCVAALFAVAVPVALGQTSGTPTIQFLSPTSLGGEVPILTDEATDVNSAYRLSAWTANAPFGAVVEFELVPGDQLTQPITIGGGEPVTPDTFEYAWDIAEGPTGVLEGRHTLKATLYDANSEELAVATQSVEIVHGTTPQAEGAPSIDLTYPVSGGPLGFYRAPNGNANSVLDSVKVDGSTVMAYFTTASPGSPPAWSICNGGESDVNFPDGVRCNYPKDDPDTDIDEGIDPSKVTAIALALEEGSADVVRVLPYAQVVNGLGNTMLGRSATTGGPSATTPGARRKDKNDQTGLFPCSDWIRVSVMDQVGRKIAGVNLDAHAQGPSDQLKFHTSYLQPPLGNPSVIPPTDGHGFPEKGTKCRNDHDTVGNQSEHGVAGRPDRKHVETRVGTSDGGTFDFALLTDQPGVTHVTVWAEQDDDDRYCLGESSTATSLMWGVNEEAPSPESPPDCGVEPSPDPTVTEPPFDGSRRVRIEPARTQVASGRNVRIVGAITAVDEACQVGQNLKLRAKRIGGARFRTIGTGITDVSGIHTFKVLVRRTKVYKVVARQAGECQRAVSENARVRAV